MNPHPTIRLVKGNSVPGTRAEEPPPAVTCMAPEHGREHARGRVDMVLGRLRRIWKMAPEATFLQVLMAAVPDVMPDTTDEAVIQSLDTFTDRNCEKE